MAAAADRPTQINSAIYNLAGFTDIKLKFDVVAAEISVVQSTFL